MQVINTRPMPTGPRPSPSPAPPPKPCYYCGQSWRTSPTSSSRGDLEEFAKLVKENREMRTLLAEYEQWEGELILNANWDLCPDGMPTLTQDLHDKMMVLQERRNQLLHPVREENE